MIGKPKYSTKDIVEFKINDKVLKGEIRIVDKWGSICDNMIVIKHSLNRRETI